MNSFGFFIDWQLGITLLWLLYRVALRGRICHRAARTYLLAVVPVAAAIAALKLPVLAPIILTTQDGVVETSANHLITAPVLVETPVDWVSIGYCVVSIGVMIFFMVGAASWVARWRKGIAGGGVRFFPQGRATASSFFGRIAVDPCCLGSDSLESIVAHERAHVAQKHSWDMLYMSVVQSALWINSAVWLLGRDVRQVHEAQADAAVLESGYSPERYIHTLLDAEIGAIGGPIPGNLAPIHYFSFCSTKKRIEMMTQLFPSRRSLWRLTAAVPVLGAMLVLFSFTRPVVVEVEQVDAPTEELTTRTQYALVVVYQKSTYDGEQFVEFRRSLEGEPKIDLEKIAKRSVLKGAQAVEYMNLDPTSEAGKTVAAGGIIVIEMKGADPSRQTKAANGAVVVEMEGTDPSRQTKMVLFRVKDNEYLKPLTENFRPKPFTLNESKAVAVDWKADTPQANIKELSEKLADQPALILVLAKTKEGKEVPIEAVGSLKGLEPKDVASVSILKGKSTAKLFGDKVKPEELFMSGDGVILITLNKTVDSDNPTLVMRGLTTAQIHLAKAYARNVGALNISYAK